MKHPIEIEPQNLGGWRRVTRDGRILGRVKAHTDGSGFTYYPGAENTANAGPMFRKLEDLLGYVASQIGAAPLGTWGMKPGE